MKSGVFKINTSIYMFDDVSAYLSSENIDDALIVTLKPLLKIFSPNFSSCQHILCYEDIFSSEPDVNGLQELAIRVSKLKYSKVIGIGGGAVLDCAKLLTDSNLQKKLPEIFSNKGTDFKKEKELILIPTTCGTGSEVTNIAIFYHNELNSKTGLAFDNLFADKAVLIPELLEQLPYKPLIHSSIDSLIHAIESLLSPKANSFTRALAKESIEVTIAQFLLIKDENETYKTLDKVSDINLIKNLLEASTLAGLAFGNAGVGAVHALSYPLGGKYHVPHGEANYLFLIEVLNTYFKYGSDHRSEELFGILKRSLKLESSFKEDILICLADLLDALCSRNTLKSYGMKIEECEQFARSVVKNQQRLLANNYRDFSLEEITEIYQKLY